MFSRISLVADRGTYDTLANQSWLAGAVSNRLAQLLGVQTGPMRKGTQPQLVDAEK